MIDSTGMMNALIAASSEFAAAHSILAREWANESEFPYYLALADYSRHLIALLSRGSHDELLSAFKTIELLIEEGDDYVRTATVVGILESLQNTNLHATTVPDQFVEFLGPTSLKYWTKIADFWEHGTIITDN